MKTSFATVRIIVGVRMVYCHTDWPITASMALVESYPILSAMQPNIGSCVFKQTLLGTMAVLAAGYCGEAGFDVNGCVKTSFATLRFIVGVGRHSYRTDSSRILHLLPHGLVDHCPPWRWWSPT